MNNGISVLTVMHDDFDFIENYCVGIRRLTLNGDVDIEVSAYFWECDPNFVQLAISQIEKIQGVSTSFYHGENIGFSRANNLLASHASQDILFFLNPDTEIKRFNVQELLKLDMGTCIIEPLMTTGISNAENDFDTQKTLFLSNDFFFYPRTTVDSTSQTYVDGAALIISKKYFDLLGEFDQNIFVFQEDMELVLRNLINGGEFHRLKDAHVHHFSGGTIGGGAYKVNSGPHITSHFRRIEAEKNQVYIASKYFSQFRLSKWLICWATLNVVSTVALLLSGEKNLAKTPWQGLAKLRKENRFGSRSKSSMELRHPVTRRFTLVPSKIVVFFRHGMPKSNVS